MGVIINGIFSINNIGGVNIRRESTAAIVSYSFNVEVNANACAGPLAPVTIYSSSPTLIIGSTLFTDSNLTIPTTYSAISNPNNPNNDYFTITGNTITGNPPCG